MKNITLRESAFSKLNLSLDVLGKRDDGYHEMLMVMQTISLCDEISIRITDGTGRISVTTDKAFLPNNEKNLGYAAAKVFLDAADIKNADVSIRIKKNVPVCAGMGGGSSDAAAVMRALNRALDAGFSVPELMKLSEKVGSDVPFCVKGGTMLATGRGTEFRELPAMPDCRFVVVKPAFSVSTPALFGKIDSAKVRVRPDTDGIIAAIDGGDIASLARRCFNVFEDALSPKERNTVNEVKNALISQGALGACMTGTGSAVFGVFAGDDDAGAAYKALSADYKELYIASPVGELK